MICPKCGKEQPEGVPKCDFCGHTFVENEDKKEEPKPRIILIQILSFTLIFMALFFLSALSTLGTILAICLLLYFTWTSIKASKHIRKLKKRRLYTGIFIVVSIIQNIWLIFTLIWSIDAAPIPNDYTIADLRSAPSEYNITYEMLCSMLDIDEIDWPREKPEMATEQMMKMPGFFSFPDFAPEEREEISDEEDALAKDLNMLLGKNHLDNAKISEIVKAHGEIIQGFWESRKSCRAIIHKLDQYDQIADLTEPGFSFYSRIPLGLLRELANIHLLYAYLACEQEDNHKIVASLIEFDSVIRKLSLNARDMISKLVCYSIAYTNIKTANYIINHPTTKDATVEVLIDHFKPIDNDITSLCNTLIYDYLAFKNMATNEVYEDVPILRWWKNFPLYKKYSTLRVCRNHCNNQLELTNEFKTGSNQKQERLSVWPDFYPDLGPAMSDSEEGFTWCYGKYNRLGIVLLQIGLSGYNNRPCQFRTDVHVRDDLLQIILAARQREPINLTARAYGDQYIIDGEKKIIYSPGPDDIPFTDDDISLPFNPAVIAIGEN